MSKDFGDDTMDLSGLDNLIKALKDSKPVGRIGILGDGAAREGEVSNAEIGLAHEFGTERLPMRSFLRMPLSTELYKRLAVKGAFDKQAKKDILKQGSIVPWLKKVMITAEAIVLEAFSTTGFGMWKPSNMKYKQNKQTLVETQQLRDSITSEVVE